MKSFDIAVQSRIRMYINGICLFKWKSDSSLDFAIKYDGLDADQQYEIFQLFLAQLKKKNLVHDYNDLVSWVKKDGMKL